MEAEPSDLVLQGHRSWGVITDLRVILLNSNHEEVAERRLCMLGGGEDDTGLEFDEEFVTGSEMQRFQRQVT